MRHLNQRIISLGYLHTCSANWRLIADNCFPGSPSQTPPVVWSGAFEYILQLASDPGCQLITTSLWPHIVKEAPDTLIQHLAVCALLNDKQTSYLS